MAVPIGPADAVVAPPPPLPPAAWWRQRAVQRGAPRSDASAARRSKWMRSRPHLADKIPCMCQETVL